MGTLMWVGLLLFLLGGLALLIAAFRVSFWWGLFCFFVPPVQLLFTIVHWGKAWRPLLVVLLGMGMMVTALVRSTDFNDSKHAIMQFTQLMQGMQAAHTASSAPVQEYSPDDPTIIGNVPQVEPPAELSAPIPDAANPDAIYKCSDAQGRVTFTQQPCAGTGAVVDDLPPINSQPAQKTERNRPVSTVELEEALQSGEFQCDGRRHCSQMTSCAEAMFFLEHCPGVALDGNAPGEAGAGDGVPCEKQWCGGGE